MRYVATLSFSLLAALANPAMAAGSACPSTDFPTFLARFADDPTLQREFVSDPLQSDSLDTEADPEPKPVSRQLSKAEVSVPLMPTLQEQSDWHLQHHVEIKGNEAQLTLRGEDSDYLLNLYFRLSDCWRLYRVQDESL